MKVLIIDDDREWAHMVGLLLGPKVEVLVASTLEEARRLFLDHEDLDLIVLDGFLQPRAGRRSDEPDTLPLLNLIRRTYSGQIVAASNDDDTNRVLCAAGCDCGAVKYKVHETVSVLLKLAS